MRVLFCYETVCYTLYAETLLARRVEKRRKAVVWILVGRCRNIAKSAETWRTLGALVRRPLVAKFLCCSIEKIYSSTLCKARGHDTRRCYKNGAPGSCSMRVSRICRSFNASRKHLTVADRQTLLIQGRMSKMWFCSSDVGILTRYIKSYC